MTEASPPFERTVSETQTSRSRFSGVFGSRYPALRKGRLPNFCSLRHTCTRSLAFAEGNVKTISNQAGALLVIFITTKRYIHIYIYGNQLDGIENSKRPTTLWPNSLTHLIDLNHGTKEVRPDAGPFHLT